MKENVNIQSGNLILDIVITKEKINGKVFFVAQGIQLDVASQGLSLEEALENIKDAAEIVLEDSDKLELMTEEKEMAPMLTRVTV